MKTIGVIRMVLVTVLLSFSFIACGSDDEDSSTNPIVGTWYVYSSDLYTEMTFENDMTFTWKEYEKNGMKLQNEDRGTYRIENDVLYTTWENILRAPEKSLSKATN